MDKGVRAHLECKVFICSADFWRDARLFFLHATVFLRLRDETMADRVHEWISF